MAMTADRAVATSAAITLLSTTAAALAPAEYGGRGELPAIKTLFGTALTFTGLSVMADFAPAVAKGLALAVLVTALTYHGLPVLNAYAAPSAEPPATKKVKGKK